MEQSKGASLINIRLVAAVIVSIALLAGLFLFTSPPRTASAACSNLPTDRGNATTTVNVSTSGTYRVWSRILAPTTSNNSFLLQIDDAHCGIVVGNATIPVNSYTWVDYQSGSKSNKINVSLSSGNHTLKLAGREDSVRVDKILLVSDMSCVPTGNGSNCETSGQTDPSPTGSVSFTGVTSGQKISGSVAIEAKTTNLSNVTKVEFFIDGKISRSEANPPFCLAVSPSPTVCSGWDSKTVANGNHTLKAKAHHSGGTTEGSVSFKVQNSNPAPPAETPDPIDEVVLPINNDKDDEKPSLSGKVVLQPSSLDGDTDRVEYYIDGKKVDGVLDTTKLEDGEYDIEVRQYKSDGTVKTDVSSVIINNHKNIMEHVQAFAASIKANPTRSAGISVGILAVLAVVVYLYINRYPVGPKLKDRFKALWPFHKTKTDTAIASPAEDAVAPAQMPSQSTVSPGNVVQPQNNNLDNQG